MKIIKTVRQMRLFSQAARQKGLSIGLVPTMGYLHEGHLSLMRQARQDNDICIISIFVNPMQFAPQEDFRRYPRDFRRDCRMAKSSGVDVIFTPFAQEMYKKDFSSEVVVRGLSSILCGVSRPTHFKGVTTAVAKLFNIIAPQVAYFGQKDFQQARIIEKMAEDLNFPIKIKILPTVREPDGLAMSSRNVYLKVPLRKDALVLCQALRQALRMVKQGERSSSAIISTIKDLISTVKSAKIDYVEIVDGKTLKPLKFLRSPAVILLAAKIGKVRLIDNLSVKV